MSADTLTDLTAEQVAQYLTENPTFFLKNEHLLTDLYLPHASGEAVSLLERQVSLLRERNIDMRKRANEMLEQGERNDVLFQKTRSLVLDLLASRSSDDLRKKLEEYCCSEFQVDKVYFSLIGNPDNFRGTQTRVVPENEVAKNMPSIVKSAESVSGNFRDEELRFLFAGMNDNIASAIIQPIYLEGQAKGFLVLGSDDPHYFKAGMDTLFLSFIGDVIARLLPRFNK